MIFNDNKGYLNNYFKEQMDYKEYFLLPKVSFNHQYTYYTKQTTPNGDAIKMAKVLLQYNINDIKLTNGKFYTVYMNNGDSARYPTLSDTQLIVDSITPTTCRFNLYTYLDYDYFDDNFSADVMYYYDYFAFSDWFIYDDNGNILASENLQKTVDLYNSSIAIVEDRENESYQNGYKNGYDVGFNSSMPSDMQVSIVAITKAVCDGAANLLNVEILPYCKLSLFMSLPFLAILINMIIKFFKGN